MALGLVAEPFEWPLWLGGVVANHALLTAAGVWPRSTLLGPNISRLNADATRANMVCITFDDGPDPEVTPAVLDLLARAGARASFFCIGSKLRAHPGLARDIVAAGHSVENHTEFHSHQFSFMGPAGFRREIGAAQETVRTIVGAAPVFFRAPAGIRSPLLDPVLVQLGLRLASWTRRGFDTFERNPQRVYRRLSQGLAAGDLLLLHDGHAARAPSGRPVVLEVLPRLLERIAALQLKTVTLPEAFAGPPAAGSPA